MDARVSAPESLALPLVALVLVGSLAGCFGGAVTPNSSGTTTAATPNTTQTTGNVSVHFINVGQGTSILLVGPTGETLLYDTGNWQDDGQHVLNYLRAHDVSRIDYLVTSHADADHVGGHAEVIEYYETEARGVGAIYDPGIAAATKTYEAYLDAVETHNVTLYQTQAGDEIPMAGLSVGVLAPPEGYLDGRERNENSLVLRAEYGNVSFLLPGDAERDGERYLTETDDSRLNATVLAAGHHGSNTSTGPRFLGATTPRVVAIQSAYDSPYGHPHRELLARLADRGIPTYWTGVHGTVAFETDGQRVTIRTQREATTDPLELRSSPEVRPGATDSLEVRASFAVGGEASGETVVADGGTPETPADDSLAVAEVHADARGDEYENLNDEYVVFRSVGDRTIDLSGWTVSDEAGHGYTFPEGTTLAPGETLTLHTGRGPDGEGDYYWGSEQPVWNNAGDTIFVRTAEGSLVLEVPYDG